MAQTDRQTDKATWWQVTAYNDEIEILEAVDKYPSYVKKVFGGREKCPDTGNIHFQGCIQLSTQMRLSALKSWLPTAHLEPAKQKDACRKYAMKEDTAIGEKLERTNPVKHYSADEICELIAYTILPHHKEPEYVGDDGIKKLYNDSIRLLLANDKKLAGQLMNPSLRNFWVSTYDVWINHALLRKTEEDAALVGEPDE